MANGRPGYAYKAGGRYSIAPCRQGMVSIVRVSFCLSACPRPTSVCLTACSPPPHYAQFSSAFSSTLMRVHTSGCPGMLGILAECKQS